MENSKNHEGKFGQENKRKIKGEKVNSDWKLKIFVAPVKKKKNNGNLIN